MEQNLKTYAAGNKPPGIAIYLRLSRQDGDFGEGKEESNSIENQRKLILQ